MNELDEDIGGTIRLGEAQITSLEAQSPSFDEKNSRLWGVVGNQSVQIILSQPAYLQVLSHARSDLMQEVGGMLVGRAYKFEGKIYVEVNGSLPARMTQSSAVHVTFSAQTWIEAQRELKEQFPDAQIVGWYHTHPGIGVFLSGQDVFIHEHFFNHPWQIALVVDPIAWQSRFFVWQDRQIMIAHSCYETFDLTRTSSLVESLILVTPPFVQRTVNQERREEPSEAEKGKAEESRSPALSWPLKAFLRWIKAMIRRIAGMNHGGDQTNNIPLPEETTAKASAIAAKDTEVKQ